jgi:NADH dehydrogenase
MVASLSARDKVTALLRSAAALKAPWRFTEARGGNANFSLRAYGNVFRFAIAFLPDCNTLQRGAPQRGPLLETETKMILITGATGFVGREVTARARAQGFSVRAIVRSPDRAQWLERELGVELFHGNILNADSLHGSMKDVKAVIHLVGIIRERLEQTFERVHTQGTQNILDAAQKAGVKRFIHMSALGARADARSRYHRSKWLAEEAVRASGLSWTIFRPSVIFGRRDEFVNELARMIRLAPFAPVIGNGQNRLQPVAVEDVAHCFVAAIRNDLSAGRIFDLVGPKSYTMNEIMRAILGAMGKRRKLIHLPWPVAAALARLLEASLRRPPLTRDQLLMLQEDNVGDGSAAEQMFAFRAMEFEKGIAEFLQQ